MKKISFLSALPLLLAMGSYAFADTTISNYPRGGLAQTTDIFLTSRPTNPNCLLASPACSYTSTGVTLGAMATQNSVLASQLPLPSSVALGGVLSSTSPANQFVTGIGSNGAVVSAQPSFANLSGMPTAAQIGIGTASVSTLLDGTMHWVPAAGGTITALTGDGTASGAGSVALTLATVNSNVGSFGSASNSVAITVDAKGRITAATSQPIAISASSVSGLAASATTDTRNASNINAGTLSGARLPTPTTSVLGGILSLASNTLDQFVTYIDSSGVQHTARPSFSNISGTIAGSQLPFPATGGLGGVLSLAPSSHQFVTGVSSTTGAVSAAQPAASDLTNGTTGSGSVVLSSSPTLVSPNIGTATGNLTGNVTGNLTGNVTGNVSGSSGSTTGNAATAAALQFPHTINGVSFDGSANIIVPASAVTLTGTALASNVLASSLTSVGTLANLSVTNTINGSINGNAASVTTNANLTGPVTSVGNATSIGSGAITNTMLAGSIAASKLVGTDLATAFDAATGASGSTTGLIQRNSSGSYGIGNIAVAANCGLASLVNGVNLSLNNRHTVTSITTSGTYGLSPSDCGSLISIQYFSNNAISLPDPASLWPGYFVYVQKISGGTWTLSPANSKTINTQASISLGRYNGGMLFTDGVNWFYNGTDSLTVYPIAQGGTGQSTQQAAIDALTGTQSSGKYLRSDGTHATLTNIQAADVPTLNQDTSGSAANFTGSLSGDVTGTQGATAISASTVTGKLLTGFVAGSGVVSTTDSILRAINKIVGNVSTLSTSLAPLASPTFVGTVTMPLTTAGVVTTTSGGVISSVAPTGSGSPVYSTSPTLVTPTLGVASATSINTTGQNTWSYSNAVTPSTVTISTSTFTPVFANSNTFQLVLTHATCTVGSPCTIANPSGTIVPGTDLTIEVKQSSTGIDYVTFGTYYKFPNGLAPVLGTSANATDIISCHVSDATHLFCGAMGSFAQ